MAIEFGSRRETFENYKVYETMLAGRPFKVEMGKMCGLSNASALIRYGETCRSVQCGHEPQTPRRRGFLPP
mgnify:CR=1 FL=1